MTELRAWKNATAIFLLCTATAIASSGQTFTTLAYTSGRPFLMSLIQGSDGNFYGTTLGDGGYTFGSIFRVAPDGALTTLYTFCTHKNCPDGNGPQGALVQATNGDFYGTTREGGNGGTGGAGTVFRISTKGKFATVYRFCAVAGCTDGADPEAGLTQAANGDLYGTTFGGGEGSSASGTVFKITMGGVLTTLHTFTAGGHGGIHPFAGVVQGTDGNFYGTTSAGGISSKVCLPTCGTIFRMTPGGSVLTLHRFRGRDGSLLYAGLIQATDGNLYGATSAGGNFSACAPLGCGTLFQITLNGTLTTLHSFALSDGAGPDASPVQATDGSFYGTTYSGGNIFCQGGCGTIYRTTSRGSFATLYDFCAGGSPCTDGDDPSNGLAQGTDGALYGASDSTVFSLDMGFGPFVAFVHPEGKVGQTSGILGQGFVGTTDVDFNGMPASFIAVSDTLIKATVPPGATTGYVTVTTPSGTLTSNVPFHVVP